MSTVITVENLGKKYLLKHQFHQQQYVALRDVISDTAASIGRKLVAPFTCRSSSIFLPHSSHSSEEFWALKDVSFEVKQGDRIGIIGRNGAGKSTLLKILSRITEPTAGSVRIKGRVASLLEVGTGFHPELTGRENIYLNGAILGMSRAEIRKKFDEIVDFAEIEKFLDTPVKRYSSGMYVRLAFAVAAHLEPEILVVDEVLAVGDAQFQKKCLGKMENIAEGGRTILFVSHNMAAINSLCQRVVFLEQGHLQGVGCSADVIKAYVLKGQENCRSKIDLHKFPRSGGDQTAIVEAWIEDGEGKVTSEVFIGAPITFCFRFVANRVLKNPGFGFGVETIYGQRIFTFGNYVTHSNQFSDIKTGIARCRVSEIPLLPGQYVMSFGLSEKHDISVDYIQRVLTFGVNSRDIFGTGRMFEPSHGFIYLNGEIEVSSV